MPSHENSSPSRLAESLDSMAATQQMPASEIEQTLPNLTETPLAESRTKSRPQVRFTDQSSHALSQELNDLLRRRMKIASGLLGAGFLAFLIKTLIVGPKLETLLNQMTLGTHLLCTIVALFTCLRLCMNCPLLLKNLRTFELLVFGTPVILFTLLTIESTWLSLEQGFQYPVATPWLLLIFTYAMFIPNTWKRAAIVLGSISLIPSVTLAAIKFQVLGTPLDSIMEISSRGGLIENLMIMTLGTVISVYGVFTVRRLRTAEFKARKLGQYQLKELIGRGGMGEVYLAEHLLLKRPCAVKLIRSDQALDPQTMVRFEREVKMTAKLTHWNSIEVYDYGHTADGTFYYVMEFLPGMSLEQLIKQHGPMPASRVVYLLKQICEALYEAHSLGMIHRDLKPGNIFSAYRGGQWDVAKLLDFGLVKTLGLNEDISVTQTGTVTGSPLYMSPEQAQGDDPDARSDIYSLGVVAYHLLTGQPPFRGDHAIKVIIAHSSEIPKPLRELKDNIPEDVEEIVLKALQKAPEDRFQSIHEMLQAFEGCSCARDWDSDQSTQWWQANDKQNEANQELDETIS